MYILLLIFKQMCYDHHGGYNSSSWKPQSATKDTAAARADVLAICSGEDRRLLVVPSFASLGIKHSWLLLKVGNGGHQPT